MFIAKKENTFLVIYLVTGYLWILFSDSFTVYISENPTHITNLQTYKGWFYVTVSGIFFYYLIHKALIEVREKKKDLELQNKRLSDMNLKLLKSNKEIKELQEEVIISLTKILEFHDQYTGGHSKKVADLTRAISIKMGLEDQEIERSYWAGIVHDIGKILVPDKILNKNSKLTDEEYEIIKKHCYWGYQTLLQSKKLSDIAKYVLYHHERWDGNGYPDGLKGNEIPLISQIICLADSWDAMTSDRSYRRALTEDEAMNEVINNRGKQFSPEIVDEFLNLNIHNYL
ncbi:MAG: HD-GYP domain-containing protein [Halanaerobiaceae bacterium]